jgi:uncharacterized membrane protein
MKKLLAYVTVISVVTWLALLVFYCVGIYQPSKLVTVCAFILSILFWMTEPFDVTTKEVNHE